eukprot:scaffold3.g6684.t1
MLLATRTGHVIYERFYCALTEPEKAELRAACDQAGMRTAADGEECVGRFRHVAPLARTNARIVMIASGGVMFYAVGSGDYTELALAEVLRALIAACIELLRASPLSEAVLFSNYAVLAIMIDSMIKEGHVELLDSRSIQRAIAFKLPVANDAPAAPESRSLKSALSRKVAAG